MLLIGATPPSLEDSLPVRYEVHALPAEEPGRSSVLRDHGSRTDIAVVSRLARVDAGCSPATSRLRLIANLGVRTDNIDVAAAHDRGIIVTNTPDVLTAGVAELTVGLTLAVVRRFTAAGRHVRVGHWPEAPFPQTGHLGGSRVGILGMGRIGKAVAQRLEPFGCILSYHNRSRLPEVHHPWFPNPVALATAVDVLIVTLPATADTHQLVDRAVVEALGPLGILVNVARGSVIDEPAMFEALVEGRLGGAGLDV